MHVECSNRGIVELDLRSVSANADERGALAGVKSLDLSRNELTQLSGLQPFSALTSLNLTHNRLHVLQGMPLNLVRLHVAHNQLTTLDGLFALPHLQELDASHNRLTELRGMPRGSPLAVLRVSHNRLPNAAGLEQCMHLHTLDLGHNCVCRLADLEPLAACPRLRSLALAGNPLCDSGGYNRLSVAQLLKGLSLLDGSPTARPQSPPAGGRHSAARLTAGPQRPRPASAPRSRPAAGAAAEAQQPPRPSEQRPQPHQRPPSPAAAGGSILRAAAGAAARPASPRPGAEPPHGGASLLRASSRSPAAPPGSSGGPGSPQQGRRGDLSFESLRHSAEHRRSELATSNHQLGSSVRELRELLEQEYQLSCSLQKQKKALEQELAESRRALNEELGTLAGVRDENAQLRAEREQLRARLEAAARDVRQLQGKLREERRRKADDLARVKDSHQAVVLALRARVQDERDTLEESQGAAAQWAEERARLREYVQVLEHENSGLAAQLSKYENASVDLAHLSHDVSGLGTSGVRVTWSPAGSRRAARASPPRAQRVSTALPAAPPPPGRGSPPAPPPDGTDPLDPRRLIQLSRHANAAADGGSTRNWSPARGRCAAAPAPAAGPAPARPPSPPPQQQQQRPAGESPAPSVCASARQRDRADDASLASEAQSEATRNAIEFAVHLKKWLLTEMDKPKAEHPGGGQPPGGAGGSAARQGRQSYAAAARLSSPPPPAASARPQAAGLEELWSRNVSLMGRQ
eukprot:TRINITY_DN11048_c1_g1_i1.p1 TRINITY_DN11048_c1_g1~~TRINITY_DN11048_c1_g1_i1.p1  ORF type:complete len:751 (+),score=230.90 TRINITY_DN11048_c1_g1_i1:93-2345(+)